MVYTEPQILDLPYYSESGEFCPEILFNSGKYSRASTALHVASLITKLCMLSDKVDTGKHARIWHEILSLYIRQISVHPHNFCASFPRSLKGFSSLSAIDSKHFNGETLPTYAVGTKPC